MYDFIVWFNNLGMWYNLPMAIFSFLVIFFAIWIVGFLISFHFIDKGEKILSVITGAIPAIIVCFLIFISGAPASGGITYYNDCIYQEKSTYEKCKEKLTVGVKKETLKKWK